MDCCVMTQEWSDVGPVIAILIVFVVAFVTLAIVAVKLLICCKIFSNAGYSWAMGLLMLIPIVNIIMAFYLAFADWPVRRELRSLQQKINSSNG
ncbi:MAG: hypothetical protein JW947_01670 [Sedimentisphaerales bacterium]|nr:hypothetical protein [Sedimentisphaerales bacterium]